MTDRKRWGIIYSIAFVIMIGTNYLVGGDVGNIADQDQAIIQPASYVFSIWGLIYVLLAIWIIRLFVRKDDPSPIYKSIHYWLVANFALNALWIVVFTQVWLIASTVVIVGLLITLIVIYKKLTRHGNHWFDRIPFSIYFGWVTVATIVNIIDTVNGQGIDELIGLNEYQWTLILLVIATLIALFVSLVHKDWLYPLVFAWAYVGIIIENENQLFLLTIIAGAGVVFHLLASAIVGFDKMRSRAER
ncbi:tryptophan-rich sensory protein [Alkalibacterium pelagium]|uniref:TspO and MBR related proteins n=1 Tax=Alkalibacterium pelagium TaxID=426702 RepID=A0A1H7FNG0_9LACT|nr:tryptophan-rich sensory protein [Alkalibacterium pelagium]GEN49370.1 hypothetical protein APE02nite_00350 [Alkalibacterium pelagium]SEK24895.1 TspO and MBR related proteins [Alkalibacterium pelagium]